MTLHPDCRALALLGLCVACGSGPDSLPAGLAGSSGQGAASASAGTGATSGSSGMIFGGGGDQPVNPEEDQRTCGGFVYESEARELDIFVMMDRSGSMVGFPDNGANIWIPIGTALKTFVAAPEAAGIGVGIQFFGLPGSGGGLLGGGESCDPNVYATAAAPIGQLPGNAAAIQAAIDANVPATGLTPTLPALQGAVQHANGWAAANPAKKVVIVLATDGAPNICNSTIPAVARVAAEGLNGPGNIETYVIGIGNVEGLNEIATSGGTGQALIVSSDPNMASQEFLEAMNEIRSVALPCDYTLPTGRQVDPLKVNLDYTPPGMTQQTRIGFAGEAGQCDPALGGWYFDNPQSPTRVFACPTTCDAMRANGKGGRVDLVVGCAREDVR